MLIIRNLNKFYTNHKVLNNINICFPSYGLFIIKGPSGSGKSTLLNAIRGNLENYDGNIIYKGKELKLLSNDELQQYQLLECGIVFQDNPLINDLSIKDNLLIMAANVREYIPNHYLNTLLKKVGLNIDENTLVNNLSGGEKQRLCIARALFFNPSILLLDEPTSSLDKSNSKEIMKIINEIAKEKLVIIVTHDETIINEHETQILNLIDGKLELWESKNVINKVSKTNTYTIKRPYKMLISYLFKRMLNKKNRTMFLIGFLSLGVFFSGLSEIMVNSVTSELKNSLKGYADPRLFMMSTIEENIENRDSLSEYALNQLSTHFSEDYLGYGTYYENDFNLLFPTLNECRLVSTSNYPLISSFNLNSINEFHWVNFKKEKVYPKVENLEDDELVLGIPFSLMKSFCRLLNISNKTYESLGDYIYHNEMKIVFYAKNSSWDYENEEIFKVSGIMESDIPIICHSNAKWSEYFFINRMRLQETLSWYEEVEYPWYLRKRSILFTKKDIFRVMDQDPNFYYYLLDEYRITSEYYSYFVSISNNQFINPSSISQICFANKSIEGYLKGSEEGYQVIKNTIIHGFKGYFCLSNNQESLFQTENKISLDENDLSFDKNVFFNSVMNPNHFNGIGILPYKKGFAISTQLANSLSLDLNANLHILYYDVNNKKFYHDTWIINDIIPYNEKYLFLSNEFLDIFFRNIVKIKSSKLKAQSILFLNNDSQNVVEILDKCNANYNEFLFSSPSKQLIDGMEQSMKGLNLGITIFAIWILLFSSILIKVVQDLYICELNNDIKLMLKLGLGRKIHLEIRFFTRVILWFLSISFALLLFALLYIISTSPYLSSLLPLAVKIDARFIIKIIIFSCLLFLISLPKKKQKQETI